jgi:hypothetical protein
MAWKRNGLFFAITDTAEMTGDTIFHNGIVQRAYTRLIRSHYAIDELLQITETQKEFAIHKIHIIHYSVPQENPDTLKTTQTILKSTQTTTEKEILFITNIIKGHKITDLIRPNNLGTMMSKAATKEHR